MAAATVEEWPMLAPAQEQSCSANPVAGCTPNASISDAFQREL
jgi:hypothetical protein